MEEIDVWYPKVFIGNSIKSLNLVSFGKNTDNINVLWYHYPDQRLRYYVKFIVTISCNLHFHTFPFDYGNQSHECIVDLKNWLGFVEEVTLNSLKIFTDDENGQEIGENEFQMKSNGRLKYDFEFKALPPTVFSDFGHDYSNAKLEIKFGRTEKSRSKIFGGYYMESEIFAMLSLISFFIHSDSVPGRMGMLIMLYLIQIDTYNSAEVPPHQGFGSIEFWFIGMQIPILLGILEYGTTLAMKKFWPVQKENKLKNIDLCTFFVSCLYLVTFNGVYYLEYIK